MTTKEIIERAHLEAKRRGVPVVQVLAEALARVTELAQSLEPAAKEPRKVRLGLNGRAIIEAKIGRQLSDEDIRRIEDEMNDREYDQIFIDGKPFLAIKQSVH